MPMIEVNGTSLFYEDTGPGSTGQTIAWSHGLLWDTSLFAPQIAALRGRYRCIAWDHRNQGRSATDHRHCISMELVAQDAAALLDKLETGPVTFAGLSMGGFVAMRLAVRRADLVARLILIETSADPEPIENVARYRLLNSIVRAGGAPLVKAKLKPIFFARTTLADADRSAEIAGYVAKMASRRDIWRAVNGVIDRAAIYDELRAIRAPTLVIVGDEDVATVPAKAERIAGAIAGARLTVIAGAGHSSTVEQPRAVTAAIEAFLDGRSPSESAIPSR